MVWLVFFILKLPSSWKKWLSMKSILGAGLLVVGPIWPTPLNMLLASAVPVSFASSSCVGSDSFQRQLCDHTGCKCEFPWMVVDLPFGCSISLLANPSQHVAKLCHAIFSSLCVGSHSFQSRQNCGHFGSMNDGGSASWLLHQLVGQPLSPCSWPLPCQFPMLHPRVLPQTHFRGNFAVTMVASVDFYEWRSQLVGPSASWQTSLSIFAKLCLGQLIMLHPGVAFVLHLWISMNGGAGWSIRFLANPSQHVAKLYQAQVANSCHPPPSQDALLPKLLTKTNIKIDFFKSCSGVPRSLQLPLSHDRIFWVRCIKDFNALCHKTLLKDFARGVRISICITTYISIYISIWIIRKNPV